MDLVNLWNKKLTVIKYGRTFTHISLFYLFDDLFHCFQVDAMKVGVKEFKKEYKKVNIDNIEVSI